MPTLQEIIEAKKVALQKQKEKEQRKLDKTIVSSYGFTNVATSTQKEDKIARKTAASGTLEENASVTGILQTKNLDAIQLDPSQEEALQIVQSHKQVALTGAAGTGKTTIVRALIRKVPSIVYVEHARAGRCLDTFFVSLTGKAVAQMRLVLPHEYAKSCMTIHTCLAVYPENYQDDSDKTKMRYVPTYTSVNKLPCKRIFIDESTMCDVHLWNQLRDALPDDCQVIFIGDINQLPPVAGQPILIHALMKFPYATLEKVHRQALNNPVLAASQLILHGQPIATTSGMVIRQVRNDPYDASYQIIEKLISLYKAGKYDPMQDQIITAGNSGALGQEELNIALLPHLTKNEMHKVFFARRFRVLSVGTKVMYTENDYGLGIFNGLQGVVKSIVPNPEADPELELEASIFGSELKLEDISDLEDFTDYKQHEEEGVGSKEDLDDDDAGRQASHIVTVLFNDGTEVALSKAKHINNLQIAFACTCHKMQGSECRKAFIIVHKSQAIHHSREWLYTAVTRAKESCMIFTSTTITKKKINKVDDDGNAIQTRAANESLNTSIQQCIDSPRILGRTTAEKIRSYYNYTKVNATKELPKWLPEM